MPCPLVAALLAVEGAGDGSVVECIDSPVLNVPDAILHARPAVHTLSIRGAGLADLGCVYLLTDHLQHLDVRNNRLRGLHFTFPMAALRTLRIDDNAVASFTGVDCIRGLETLTADGNQLGLTDTGGTPAQPEPLSFAPLSDSLVSLSLRRNGLEFIPRGCETMTRLSSLSVSRNDIENLSLTRPDHAAPARPKLLARLKVNDDGFSALQSLRSLDFQHNKVDSFPAGLYLLPCLEILTGSHNRLTNLDFFLLRDMQGLTQLRLNNNRMTELPDSCSNLLNLAYVDVSHNQLTELCENLTQLQGLSTLHCHHNKIEKLEKNFGRLTALTDLSIHHNKLTRVADLSPIGAPGGSGEGVEDLDFSHNDIPSLPEYVADLCGVVSLNFERNALMALPREVVASPRLGATLQMLLLSHNNLSSIPEEIGNLAQLNMLLLSNNCIRELPRTIFTQLASLETLWVDNNKLCELPKEIGELKKLKSFWCHANELSELPENVCLLTAVEEISCGSNQIERLPSSLDNLVSMRRLMVDENRIKVLPNLLAALLKFSLESLTFEGCPLEDPPLSVRVQGYEAVMSYLDHQYKSN